MASCLAESVSGPRPLDPFRRNLQRLAGLSRIVASQLRNSRNGARCEYPSVTMLDTARSVRTTVHVQHPNLPTPQGAPCGSRMIGQSDPAARYKSANRSASRLFGDARLKSVVHTSLTAKSTIGAKTSTLALPDCRKKYLRLSDCFASVRSRCELSPRRVPRRTVALPPGCLPMMRRTGSIRSRSVHQRNLLVGGG